LAANECQRCFLPPYASEVVGLVQLFEFVGISVTSGTVDVEVAPIRCSQPGLVDGAVVVLVGTAPVGGTTTSAGIGTGLQAANDGQEGLDTIRFTSLVGLQSEGTSGQPWTMCSNVGLVGLVAGCFVGVGVSIFARVAKGVALVGGRSSRLVESAEVVLVLTAPVCIPTLAARIGA